jgi:N-terminal domain of galactosyltransferase/N-terminal region of glycosyl transferase group 7
MDARCGELCVIVPYRDRREHLDVFVPHLLSFLRGAPMKLLVVEQRDDKPFNRGKLLNTGFHLVRDDAGWICFHDVDMLPIDRACDYSRPACTTHLAGRVEQFSFRLPYQTYIGGVLITRPEDFIQANGFSNEYWGWGSEDDDLYLRYRLSGIQIVRRPGRYRSLQHDPSERPDANRQRFQQMAREAIDSGHLDPLTVFNLRQSTPTASAPTNFRHEGLNTLRWECVSRRPLHEIVGTATTEPIDLKHEFVSIAT